jgi:hypothetical protein
MKTVSENEKDEAWERETEGWPQSAKYFNFVSIWQTSGILMTGQSRWISRVERSTILVTALFLSSTVLEWVKLLGSIEIY